MAYIRYEDDTKIKFATHALAGCGNPDDVLDALDRDLQEFKDYRDKKERRRKWLKPMLHLIGSLSGTAGEAAGVPVPFAKAGVVALVYTDVDLYTDFTTDGLTLSRSTWWVLRGMHVRSRCSDPSPLPFVNRSVTTAPYFSGRDVTSIVSLHGAPLRPLSIRSSAPSPPPLPRWVPRAKASPRDIQVQRGSLQKVRTGICDLTAPGSSTWGVHFTDARDVTHPASRMCTHSLVHGALAPSTYCGALVYECSRGVRSLSFSRSYRPLYAQRLFHPQRSLPGQDSSYTLPAHLLSIPPRSRR
ncbi:hypothetical protein B0H10DRAFT_2221331 [Mycena sp. CBHHK59/15]|nr:hypothetical protein B0H10DRAFT_2221331 [Mycena sp. CBHHK59/15]